ncbi:DUF4158 domain-containing protein [Sphaerisporangium fuscum]|uniref:DUF4158 domain-containing protein n=1 Tax=Sphaerisporangium fuscum TaxID=2835868 RepID=UPI001BDC122E|nr:DUF4158 domain-containing protein [Sphaerisporangium fuscum]
MFLPTFYTDREKGRAMRREWEREDLIECWTLDEDEFALVGNKTGATRLGFGLLLKFFGLEGRFPRREDVPKPAVDFIAGQVKVAPELFGQFDFVSRQVASHRKQIREFYQFQTIMVGDEDKLIVWMAEEICPVDTSRDRLRSAFVTRYRQEKIEPPTPGQAERLLGAAEPRPICPPFRPAAQDRSCDDQRACARSDPARWPVRPVRADGLRAVTPARSVTAVVTGVERAQ